MLLVGEFGLKGLYWGAVAIQLVAGEGAKISRIRSVECRKRWKPTTVRTTAQFFCSTWAPSLEFPGRDLVNLT